MVRWCCSFRFFGYCVGVTVSKKLKRGEKKKMEQLALKLNDVRSDILEQEITKWWDEKRRCWVVRKRGRVTGEFDREKDADLMTAREYRLVIRDGIVVERLDNPCSVMFDSGAGRGGAK